MSELRRVALITGANQGIGFALAQALGADGCRVIVNGQRSLAVAEAVRQLREGGADATGFSADVSDEGAVTRMFEEIDTCFGRLDIAVNNAGIAPHIGGRSARSPST